LRFFNRFPVAFQTTAKQKNSTCIKKCVRLMLSHFIYIFCFNIHWMHQKWDDAHVFKFFNHTHHVTGQTNSFFCFTTAYSISHTSQSVLNVAVLIGLIWKCPKGWYVIFKSVISACCFVFTELMSYVKF
jgi:hypothetical protein